MMGAATGLARMRDDINSAIQRCDREIESCVAYDGPDKHGALWGEMDWRVEREILKERAMEKRFDYERFIASKSVISQPVGFAPGPVNPMLFDFQADVDRWAIRRGRAALLEDCGLGKGPQQLEWAKQVSEHSGQPVIGFAPLAVARQFQREATKFGYEITVVATQDDIRPGINVTNYDKLHHFKNSRQFSGIFIDESSILKSFDGKFRQQITEFASVIPYRLAASATAAPNDFMELGTHAEFLGVMTAQEMLATFFVHDGGDTRKWRIKGHAQQKFWEWVASWAVCIRRPSDLGYDDGRFILPPLHMHQHTVRVEDTTGYLFPVEGRTLQERHAARRDSISERVSVAADLVNSSTDQWLVWCNLNNESTALTKAIHDAVEVTGLDSDAHKERSAIDFAEGRIRVMVSKPKIFGYGLNFQNCSNVAFVGLSDSYEQIYQAIRRCWRFGQDREVNFHMICAETEGAVVRNIQRKEQQADEMFNGMVEHMRDISTREIRGAVRERDIYSAAQEMILPDWMTI